MQAVVRLEHLKSAFLSRLSEWTFAAILLMWGVVLLMPEATFDKPSYTAFRLVWSEEGTGVAFLLIGAVRLGILSVNGIWRPMYYFRAFFALISVVIWSIIIFAFMSSMTFGTWIALYPVILVIETVNVFRAMSDAADMERARRGIGAA